MVLVVDDDIMNIEVMRTLLDAQEIKCDVSFSGKQALQLIEERTKRNTEEGVPMYKIILLDYSMPLMNGPEVATKLIHYLKLANLEKPYICCCTAYAEASFKRHALAVGMDHFLTKPIDSEEMMSILSRLNRWLYKPNLSREKISSNFTKKPYF